MRLIDVEALKKKIRKDYHPMDEIPFFEVMHIISNAPTVDERPKGKWINREDMNYLDENKVTHKHFMCDRCGLIHDFIDGHTAQYNFCPNCGARMRGDV